MTQPCRYAAKGLFNCLGVDVFVNSSGILCNGDTLSLSLEAYDRCMNINTRSAFILMQKVLPHLIQTKGNIVNVSSVTGIRVVSVFIRYTISFWKYFYTPGFYSIILSINGSHVLTN